MPNTAYERIMNLIGNDDFKRAANDLVRYAENRKRLPNCSIRLPNFMFATAPGCGVSTHLRMFADLLTQLQLIRPRGGVSCFEWVLDEGAFSPNGGFDRLLDAISRFSGTNESFHGVIGVDVSAWQEHPDDKLDRLILLADDLQNEAETVFVYVVDLKKKEDSEALLRLLSSYTPIETVTFEFPKPQQMIGFFEIFFERRGITLVKSDDALLLQAMEKLSALPDYDGLQTISNIVDEIIYKWMISGDRSEYVIPAYLLSSHIMAYTEQYGRALNDTKAVRRIGFRGGY